MADKISEIIERYEALNFDDSVKYVSHDPAIVKILRQALSSQCDDPSFSPPLFEWFYKCVQQRQRSNELYTFCLQFTPDLVILYLQAVYENKMQLKANAEALLLDLLLEIEKDKPAVGLQVPTVSKTSIYHQSVGQITQPILTEAALQRHNQTEAPRSKHSFSRKQITVNNRLIFLSTVIEVFCDHFMLFTVDTWTAYCQCCIRLSLQGMEMFTNYLNTLSDILPTDLKEISTLRRFAVSDSLVSSLLRGVRICLFQSNHALAMGALEALKMRAEYELLTTSIQISHTLFRLVDGIKPIDVQMDMGEHSCYHGEGNPNFQLDPSRMHITLNSHILQFNMSKIEDSATQETRQSSIRTVSKSTAV